MEVKSKTASTTHIKHPLQHVGQHFPKQCLNDNGDKKHRRCTFCYETK